MDLTKSEWVVLAFFLAWGTLNSIGEPAAFVAGAYTGALIFSGLAIGTKRQINGWRRARAADT